MAFDLVPNNRNLRVEGWSYLSEEDNKEMFVIDEGPDGKFVFNERSTYQFPPNVFTLTNKQWRPFWAWVIQRNSRKGAIFSIEELKQGKGNNGLYVSQHQCEALVLDLDAAIQTASSIPARPTRTVAFIREGDEKVPVVGWTRSHAEGPNEFPIVKRDGDEVIAVEFDVPKPGEPLGDAKAPTVYTEETLAEEVTTHEDGTQTVGDTEGGDWYYWTLPRYIAVALLEFIRNSNGFTIL